MRLTTWNVNGIRNPFSYPPWNVTRTFSAMFDVLGSDIVVMQELKIQRKDLRDDMVLIDGWDAYFSLPKHKKGYSGVGIYTRNATCAPIRAEEGVLGVLTSPSGVPFRELPNDQCVGGYPSALQISELGVDPAALDSEGRCLILEFPAFVLLGVYSPANSNGLRDDFRHGFICALDCRIRNLIHTGKRVVLVGDLNVSRDELDTASSLEDCRKAGITHEDYVSTPNRRIFNQLIVDGEVIRERDKGREHGVLWDTTRGFHPDRKGMYTHWEQKINARPGNFGSRIDFVLVSDAMRSWVRDANIQEGLLGSDHCPVFADFHDTIDVGGIDTHIADLMNPPGVFEAGIRRQEWKVLDVPSFSAKRLPEFDKRRSIKSMFAAPTMKNGQHLASDVKPPAHLASVTETSSLRRKATDEATVPDAPPSASTKRKGVGSPGEMASKKSKIDSKASSSKGQQSLKGFFRSHGKQADVDASSTHAALGECEGSIGGTRVDSELSHFLTSPSLSANGHIDGTQRDAQIADHLPPSPPRGIGDWESISPSQVAARLEASEQTQRSWGALFARPIAPMCEGHNEPCNTMQTKKKGTNQGRSFWMCARPLGPSGEKEKGTQWRCPTFIWCSDWSARKGKEGE